MIKAETAIILTLDGGPLVQMILLIEEDELTTKDLWEELLKTYDASKDQFLINLQQKIEYFHFMIGQEWE